MFDVIFLKYLRILLTGRADFSGSALVKKLIPGDHKNDFILPENLEFELKSSENYVNVRIYYETPCSLFNP